MNQQELPFEPSSVEEDYHPYMGRERRQQLKESQERMKKMLQNWRQYQHEWRGR